MNTAYTIHDKILNGMPITEYSIKTDLFGKNFIEENYGLMYGVYEGLIKHKGVTKKMLYDCFITNRLDELIHKKYTIKKNSYYIQFCEKNIIIGETFYNLSNDDEEEQEEQEVIDITTDDYCETCGTVGFYTKNYITDNAPDCRYCGKLLCNLCKIDNTVKKYGEIEKVYVCFDCSTQRDNPNILTAVQNKINGYKSQDNIKGRCEGNVSVEDIFQLLKTQEFKCYVCKDEVKTSNWKPYCLYQFTLDRIDNNLPHNRDNVLISCYYCNCIDVLMGKNCSKNTMNKKCVGGCHNIGKNFRSREDVTKEEIDKIKLQGLIK
jgi:hypothetical protein